MTQIVTFALETSADAPGPLRRLLGGPGSTIDFRVGDPGRERLRVGGVVMPFPEGRRAIPVERWERRGTATGEELGGRAGALLVRVTGAPHPGVGAPAARRVAEGLGVGDAVAAGFLVTELVVLDDVGRTVVSVRFTGVRDGDGDGDGVWALHVVRPPPPRAEVDDAPDGTRVAPFVAGGFEPGAAGEVALAVSDAWLDRVRAGIQRILSVQKPIVLTSSSGGVEIPWLEAVDRRLRYSDGVPVQLLELLRGVLRASVLRENPGWTSDEVDAEVTRQIDKIGVIKEAFALPRIDWSNDLLAVQLANVVLSADVSKVTVDAIRATAKGIAVDVSVPELVGSAAFSLHPSGTAASVLLDIATSGAFSATFTHGGPVEMRLSDITLRLLLEPDRWGTTWTVRVPEMKLKLFIGFFTTNLLHWPVVAAANAAGAVLAHMEMVFLDAFKSKLQDRPIPVAWPGLVHVVGAPPVRASAVTSFPGAGLALVASLSDFSTPAPSLPFGSVTNAFYSFSTDFLYAWVDELCGPMRVVKRFSSSELAGVGLAPPPPPPRPLRGSLDAEAVIAKLIAAHPGHRPGTLAPPPSPRAEVRASMRVDTFDIILAPRPEVAFSLQVHARFLLEGVEIHYGVGHRVVEEHRGKIGEMEFYEPPRIDVFWVESAKTVVEHVSASFELDLDVQVGLQCTLDEIGTTILLPAVAARAAGPIRSTFVERRAQPAFDTPAGWQNVQTLVGAVFDAHFGPLLRPASRVPVTSSFPLELHSGEPLLMLGQPGGGAFSYRTDSSRLIWDLDIAEGLTRLIR